MSHYELIEVISKKKSFHAEMSQAAKQSIVVDFIWNARGKTIKQPENGSQVLDS